MKTNVSVFTLEKLWVNLASKKLEILRMNNNHYEKKIIVCPLVDGLAVFTWNSTADLSGWSWKREQGKRIKKQPGSIIHKVEHKIAYYCTAKC